MDDTDCWLKVILQYAHEQRLCEQDEQEEYQLFNQL